MNLRLMCTWGFNPARWGGIGFSDEAVQNELAQKKPIVAIYITEASSLAVNKQGMVVGFVELSDATGDISEFISEEALAEHLEKDENKNRWPYAVGMRRAWKVRPDNWQSVKTIFPNTRGNNNPRNIGRRTVPVKKKDFANIEELKIRPVEVYQPPNGLPAEQYATEEYETARDLLISRELIDE